MPEQLHFIILFSRNYSAVKSKGTEKPEYW